jgi:hypothetical protein
MASTVEQDTTTQVERIEALMRDAEAARQDFLAAGREFAQISQAEAGLLGDLMDAAVRMHTAKIRIDAAVAEIKAAAGLI